MVHRIEKRAFRILRAKLDEIISDGKVAIQDMTPEQKHEHVLSLNSIGWRRHEIAAVLGVESAYVTKILRDSDRRGPCGRKNVV